MKKKRGSQLYTVEKGRSVDQATTRESYVRDSLATNCHNYFMRVPATPLPKPCSTDPSPLLPSTPHAPTPQSSSGTPWSAPSTKGSGFPLLHHECGTAGSRWQRRPFPSRAASWLPANGHPASLMEATHGRTGSAEEDGTSADNPWRPLRRRRGRATRSNAVAAIPSLPSRRCRHPVQRRQRRQTPLPPRTREPPSLVRGEAMECHCCFLNFGPPLLLFQFTSANNQPRPLPRPSNVKSMYENRQRQPKERDGADTSPTVTVYRGAALLVSLPCIGVFRRFCWTTSKSPTPAVHPAGFWRKLHRP